MRTIRGIISSDLRVDEPCSVRGIVNGSIDVTAGGRLTFNGICNGRINVEPGGRARVAGIISGGVHYQTGGPG